MNDSDLIDEFMIEAGEQLDVVDDALRSIEQNNGDRNELLNQIFRSIHSIKGNSSFFEAPALTEFAHDLETLLDALRQGRCVLSEECMRTVYAGVDTVRDLVCSLTDDDAAPAAARMELQRRHFIQYSEFTGENEIELACRVLQSVPSTLTTEQADALKLLLQHCGNAGVVETSVLSQRIHAQRTSLIIRKVDDAVTQGVLASEALEPVNSGSTAEDSTAPDATPAPHPTGKDRKPERKTIRIDEERIDAFLAHVGELLVVGDMFRHVSEQLAVSQVERPIAENLRQTTRTFRGLSAKLQQAIMAIRRVPAQQLLRKTPKLIRDVASQLGKDIRCDIIGGDLELDKSHAELLDSPLVHMIRNACDHGIEAPALRIAAGKPAHGTIRIELSLEQDALKLKITDDGGGLNLNRLQQTAVEMGILTDGVSIDEQAIVQVLFAPGVSTAAQVSDISGRGVGMDAVKRAIEDANGRISVATESGRGTSFTIHLPSSVTTHIGMGFFVNCGEEVYILDLDTVHETFPCRDAFTQTPEGVTILRRRDDIYPIIDLNDLLGISQRHANPIAITVIHRGLPYALIVDEAFGIKQMVKMPLNLCAQGDQLFHGVALQGDGSLAPIIDIDGLIALAAKHTRIDDVDRAHLLPTG